jgi:hypothetical protein
MLKGAIDIALSRLDAAPELEAYLRERLGPGERPRSSG